MKCGGGPDRGEEAFKRFGYDGRLDDRAGARLAECWIQQHVGPCSITDVAASDGKRGMADGTASLHCTAARAGITLLCCPTCRCPASGICNNRQPTCSVRARRLSPLFLEHIPVFACLHNSGTRPLCWYLHWHFSVYFERNAGYYVGLCWHLTSAARSVVTPLCRFGPLSPCRYHSSELEGQICSCDVDLHSVNSQKVNTAEWGPRHTAGAISWPRVSPTSANNVRNTRNTRAPATVYPKFIPDDSLDGAGPRAADERMVLFRVTLKVAVP